MSAHAPLPPSGAPQWGVCSGSIMAQMSCPDIEHPRTRAGSASHWVASECLEQWQVPGAQVPLCKDWIGKTAPNGVVIDEETAEGAQVFVRHALRRKQKLGKCDAVLIEHRVNMPRIHAQNWGTLDLCLARFDRDERGRITGGTVYLIDYKFGHRQCKAEGNLQLINYFAGILEKYGIGGIAEQNMTAVFEIVQPFCYQNDGPVDSWMVNAAELRGYYNQLERKAWEVFNRPTFTAGPQCRDCKALARCATVRQSHYSLIDYVNQPYEIDTMSSSDLAVERGILLAGLETAKSRLEAVEEELAHRIGQGDKDSGLVLQTGQGRLKWTVPTPVAISFAKQFGVDASKAGVLTPTQVIDAADADRKPLIKQAMRAVAKRPSTGLKLTKAADSRTVRAFTKK